MPKRSIHRWWNLVLVAAYFCLQGIPACAGVYANILWGPFPGRTEWPNYASGTRCEFVVHVYTNTPYAYITRVRIQLGGETIKDVRLSGGAFMPYIYIVTRFASTHFADSTNLEIRAEGWDSAGGTASTSRFVTVYNKATLYGRNEWENDPSAPSAGVPHASRWLVYMNHDVSHTCIEKGWIKQMVLNDLLPCTVFYVNTHGGREQFPPDGALLGYFTSDLDELYPGNPDYIEKITTRDIKPVREQALGTGDPPFNTGLPPITLAFVDACSTSEGELTDPEINSLAEGFLVPYRNGYNHNWCENQSHVGWRIAVFINRTSVSNEAFWGALAQGKTVHQARNEMVRAYFGLPNPITDNEAREYVSVWGDYHTRLHGLYTGNDSLAPNFWYY